MGVPGPSGDAAWLSQKGRIAHGRDARPAPRPPDGSLALLSQILRGYPLAFFTGSGHGPAPPVRPGGLPPSSHEEVQRVWAPAEDGLHGERQGGQGAVLPQPGVQALREAVVVPRRWGKQDVERDAPGPPPPRRGVAVFDDALLPEREQARIERELQDRPMGLPPAPKVIAQGAAAKRDEAVAGLCDYLRLEFLPRVLTAIDHHLP